MAEITHSGQQSVATLGGDIRLETGRGRLVIYDPVTHREINVVDRTGYRLTDGEVTTTIEAGRFIQNDGTTDRLLLGNEDS